MPLKKIPGSAKPYLFFAALFLALPTIVSSYDGDTGKLLVASGAIDYEPFRRAVVYLYRNDLSGATGLVLNKPLSDEQRAQRPDLEGLKAPVLYGGPVGFPDTVSVLRIETDMDGLETLQVQSLEKALEREPELLENLRRAYDRRYDLRFYIGYAGWSPLQLENEILRHEAWATIDPDEEILFTDPSQDMWSKAMHKSFEDNPPPLEGT